VNIKKYILEYFEKSDLSPVGSYISSKYHLRFELGGGLENGTRERVNQSVCRAVQVFEEFFKPSDDVDILIKSFEYLGDAKEFYTSDKGYLEAQIEGFEHLEILREETLVEEFHNALNEDDVMTMTDFTTNHIQRILSQKLHKLNYENIFRAIANLEMGFTPSVSEGVFFINRRNNVAFHMYDDRGCLLFAHDRKSLKPLYNKLNSWLVDYHRETFDQLFSQ